MQKIYRWGWWVWYFRGLALVAYLCGPLVFLGGGAVLRRALRTWSWTDLLLLLLWLALLAAWMLWAWVNWRNGQSRAVEIEYVPQEGLLLVDTLNFTRRRIPRELLEEAHLPGVGPDWGSAGYYGDWYYEGMMTVPVQGQLPLRIDTAGKILDRELFKAALGKVPPEPPAGDWRKRRRRRPARKDS